MSATRIIPPSNQDFHLQSFFPGTVIDWNILPQETVYMGTVEPFTTCTSSRAAPCTLCVV